MKISETKRNHIDEGPLDLLTKSGRAQRRAFKQGQKTVKLTAQNLQREFAEYLGVQGKKNMRQATTQDVIDFLDRKNVDTSDIDTAQPMDPNRLKAIFTDKSRLAAQGKGTKQPAAKNSSPKFKSKRSKTKLKLPADVVSSVSKLSKKQKIQLAQALQDKYGN